MAERPAGTVQGEKGPMSKVKGKTPAELARMRRAGKVVAATLKLVKNEARPSVTTGALDRMAEELIRSRGAVPAFKGYRGYPATLCTSINEQVVHGIPGTRELREGDLLSVDVGAFVDGYAADAAISIPIGECAEEVIRLIHATRGALGAALEVIRSGVRVAEISRAIQQRAERDGYSVVRKYTGHGIGREMHEELQVPNFVGRWPGGRGPKLPRGTTVAIEPMLNAGSHQVEVLEDGWTVVTADGELSAHWEHTLAVQDEGPVILTAP